MDNKSQQNDEVELLQSIMFDSLTIEKTEPYHVLKMEVKSDVVEIPELNVVFEVEFTENYPDTELFKYKVYETRNRIAPTQFKALYTEISNFFEENIGSPIVYQIVELIREFINPLEEKRQEVNITKMKEAELMEKLKETKLSNELLGNKKLLETKKFTPVTKENYQIWFEKYMKEKVKEGGKELKQRKEILSRMSGRDFFMQLKNKEDNDKYEDDQNDDGDDGEDIDYDQFKDQKKKEREEKYKNGGNDYDDEYDEDKDEDFNPDLFKDEDVDLDEIDFDDDEE